VRLFIAAPLPEVVRAQLRLQQDRLKPRREAVNWVKDEHLHLSLRFLGETDERRVEAVADLLDELALQAAALDLRLGEPGFFGSEHRPRVIWTGLAGQIGALEALARRLELGLQRLGVERSPQRFKAHLTLGRVRSCRPDLLAAHLGAPPLPVGFVLRELRLIQSTLKPTGPIHDVLTRHILTGSKAR
jgi:RNA 2',3'-cyclic 3'-phosphodiesterase